MLTKLVVLPCLLDCCLVLLLPKKHPVLDITIPTHHHVQRTTERTDEVDGNQLPGVGPPRRVESPQHLTSPLVRVGTMLRVDIGERVVCLALGTVLEECNGIVERHANLAQDIELVVGEPYIVDVVGAQRRGNGEAGKGIAVARTEPELGLACEVVNIATKEFPITPVR